MLDLPKDLMPTFLFWNMNGKRLESLVASLAAEHNAEIVVLAECEIPVEILLHHLNKTCPAFQYSPRTLCEKIEVFTKFRAEFLKPLDEGKRYSIRRLALPAREEILVAVAHLPSKINFSEASQKEECCLLAGRIRRVEEQEGHERTVLFGDLNVNPFESGVISTIGFHASMTRSVAAKGNRVVQGHSYPFVFTIRCGVSSGT